MKSKSDAPTPARAATHPSTTATGTATATDVLVHHKLPNTGNGGVAAPTQASIRSSHASITSIRGHMRELSFRDSIDVAVVGIVCDSGWNRMLAQ